MGLLQELVWGQSSPAGLQIASRLWVHACSLVPALLLDWTLSLGVNQLQPDSNLHFTSPQDPSILGHCPLNSSLGSPE